MADTPRSPVFTIGHSNHPLEKFLAMLERHGVDQAVDVRSTPFSRFAPHFNRKNLEARLGRAGMGYVFLGAELGGRPGDPAHYDENGRARCGLMAETPAFRQGIRHVIEEAGIRRTVLLCTGRDPLECHRTLLVAPALANQGIGMEHILAGGNLESHAAAMDRLTGLFKLPPGARDDMIAEAMDRQARRVAYVRRRK